MSNQTLLQLKLLHFERKYGKLTKDEALQLAIDADKFKTDCGVFDIAFSKFAEDTRGMLEYAELLERLENGDKKTG